MTNSLRKPSRLQASTSQPSHFGPAATYYSLRRTSNHVKTVSSYRLIRPNVRMSELVVGASDSSVVRSECAEEVR